MINPFLISVVVPVYNTEKYITEALDSVFAQDYKNLEVIVVNDGSTDSTLDILEKYPKKIKIISQENKGQSVARNVGIREARGSLIGLLDGDDIWPENHFSLVLKYFENNDYDFIRGNVRSFRDGEDGKRIIQEPMFLEMLVGASFCRRSLFDKVGLFDEDMRQGEDVDWFIRIIENNCKEKRVEDTMLFYRRHETNLTNSKKFITDGLMNASRQKLKRNKFK